MRFFVSVCMFGLLIGSVGCMTNNWSSPLFKNRLEATVGSESQAPIQNGRRVSGLSGSDQRAREIEKRLGI